MLAFFLEASDAPRCTGDPRILKHRFFTAMPDLGTLHPRLQYGGATLIQRLRASFSAATTTAKRKQVTEPAMPPAKQQKAPPAAVPVSGGAPEPEEEPADWEEAAAAAMGWD